MVNYNPYILLSYVRDGLVEQEHSGFIVRVGKDGLISRVGDDLYYPFYLRSCAKPLQATLIVDNDLSSFFSMTNSEVALCCASHAGEPCHVDVAKSLLCKIGLSESPLKCGFHKPLSKTEKEKLLLSGDKESVFQNNCSGKHIMMLALCKKNGWSIDDYDDINHPLQQAIKSKIYELCEVEKDYPVTKDGCGVPIYSMPLVNMVIGYLNLFLDEKYFLLRESMQKNPYLIGGVHRLDTAIMTANPNLIAKVGAGGICIVINLQLHEGLIIKVLDSDMKARALCLFEALSQLGWLDSSMMNNHLIKNQNQKDILTLHGEKVGQAEFCFKV